MNSIKSPFEKNLFFNLQLIELNWLSISKHSLCNITIYMNKLKSINKKEK